MKVDPRILRRRLAVAEGHARSRVRRSLVMLMVMAAAGMVAWFVLSPHLSVAVVEVEGADEGDVGGILASQKVVEGRPMVAIRAGRVEEALLEDPWIRAASVKLVFPTRVQVNVREREEVAWLWLDGKWGLLADDGVLLEYASIPGSLGSIISIPVEDPGLGSQVADVAVLGALEFAGALPGGLEREVAVQLKDDELWGLVGDRPVRLGLPVKMAAKAVSLAMVINVLPEGLIDMTSPSRPAIRHSGTVQPTPISVNPNPQL